MKKTNITIQYDDEKLETLNVYLKGKGVDINEELCKAIDNLYNKLVPPAVRDFFEKKSDTAHVKKPVANTRSSAPKKPPVDKTESPN